MTKMLLLILALFATSAAAQVRTFLVDRYPVSLPTGTLTIGPMDLPDNKNEVVMRVKRCTGATPMFWCNPTTRILGTDGNGLPATGVSISFDGGVSWLFWCGFGAEGGIFKRRGTGAEVPETVLECQAFPPGTGRKIKAAVMVDGGPLVTEVTLEIR